ncbi:MAG: carbamoyltransferase C-terminal domain-containing protein [Bryobacteraceae bacterium]
MSRTIVGLGGFLSDPACCVVRNGELVSAVEQKKVSRHDRPETFPEEAFAGALEIAGIGLKDIECVAVARRFTTTAESAAQLALRARFPQSDIVVVEHHHSHAASAFYTSSFENARVLSLDRAGDYRSAVLYQAAANHMTPIREMYFPDSFGDLFNRVTELIGFQPRGEEHKVQWLSTLGQPCYLPTFRNILRWSDSAWPRFDRSYLDADELTQGGFSTRFYEECGLARYQPLSAEAKADMAASIQTAVEEAVVRILGDAENVCVAGGLALNSLLVRALEGNFARVHVQPVGGNAGTSIGAALYAWHNHYGQSNRIPFRTLCLGAAYSPQQIKQVLENCKLRFLFIPTEGELIDRAVQALNDFKVVGWMQGRSEFGSRALGNRSILASPQNPYSTENLNVYIKHRETFRKFAASVPAEMADKYFEVGPNANYLATVGKVRSEYRDAVASAVLGNDDLIRVHTVRREENPMFHSLLIAAGRSTGLPLLYNTSFNLFGDPLVYTPRDALRSFYSSGIDTLFAGNFVIDK